MGKGDDGKQNASFGLRPFWTLGFLALLLSKHRSSS